MYLDFYNLKAQPFNITPDPRYLFFSRYHREAFEHIIFGITQQKGFIQITGEVGAGKSTLCRAILDELDENYSTALILNPVMTAIQLLRSVLRELDLDDRGNDRVRAHRPPQHLSPGTRRRRSGRGAPHRRGPGHVPGSPRAGASAVESGNRRPQAPPDRARRPARAQDHARERSAASAQPAHHGALPHRPDPQGRDRGLYPSPAPGCGFQRSTEFHRPPRTAPSIVTRAAYRDSSTRSATRPCSAAMSRDATASVSGRSAARSESSAGGRCESHRRRPPQGPARRRPSASPTARGCSFRPRISNSSQPLEPRARARPRRGHRRCRHGRRRQCGVVASQPERTGRRPLGLRSPATGEASLATITASSPALPELPDCRAMAVPTTATASETSSESVRPDGEAGRPAAQLTVAVDPPPARNISRSPSVRRWIHRYRGWRRCLCPRGRSREGPASASTYIVFRPDDPFAEINGIELHPGGVVEGFRVKAIERDRVHLSDGRRTSSCRAP